MMSITFGAPDYMVKLAQFGSEPATFALGKLVDPKDRATELHTISPPAEISIDELRDIRDFSL